MKKIYRIGSRAFLIFFVCLLCLWMISGAKANTAKIQDIVISNSDEQTKVEVILSENVAKDKMTFNYDRNFLQLSMADVNAFPAITKSVDGKVLEKIFAYQYQPDLARVRFILNDKSEKYKNLTKWETSENKVALIFKSAKQTTDAVVTKAAALAPIKENLELKEVELLKKVAASKALDIPKAALDSETQDLFKQPVESPEKTTEVFKKKNEDPSAGIRKMTINLLMVLSLIGIVTYFIRKFVLAKNGLQFGKNKPIINMVSNYSLGPKKSIALVKVADQYMVLGISGDNINLISNLGPEANIDSYLDKTNTDDTFKGILEKSVTAQTAQKTNTNESMVTFGTAVRSGIRSLVKKRLENFKPL